MKDRKKAVICAVFAVLAAFIVVRVYIYLNKPEFHIMHSYSSNYTMQDGTRCRDSSLNVIVYKNRNDPELYKRIKTEHNRINGEPTELTIQLFKSKNDIIKGHEPYKVITINYINDTVEIEKRKNRDLSQSKDRNPCFFRLCGCNSMPYGGLMPFLTMPEPTPEPTPEPCQCP